MMAESNATFSLTAKTPVTSAIAIRHDAEAEPRARMTGEVLGWPDCDAVHAEAAVERLANKEADGTEYR